MTPVRPVEPDEFDRLCAIINGASTVYRGRIPDDCWHDPYMPAAKLRSEIAAGVRFFGIDRAGRLAAVMGVQDVKDVHLVRHAYVTRDHQGEGLGGELLDRICETLPRRTLVGTWRAADWAIRFYEKHGFELMSRPEAAQLLEAYWEIPQRQAAESVVLSRPPIDPS